jgi:hypothetical protein
MNTSYTQEAAPKQTGRTRYRSITKSKTVMVGLVKILPLLIIMLGMLGTGQLLCLA